MRNSDRKNNKSPLEDVEMFLNLLHRDGSVFQVAAIGVQSPKSELWNGFASGSNPIVLGWFQDPKVAADTITNIDEDSSVAPKGIYVSLNPMNPSLLSRSNQRLKAGIGATRDEDVECFRHLFIDLDPKRPSDTNSSEREHASTLRKAD